MVQAFPASVGQSLDEVETPAHRRARFTAIS